MHISIILTCNRYVSALAIGEAAVYDDDFGTPIVNV